MKNNRSLRRLIAGALGILICVLAIRGEAQMQLNLPPQPGGPQYMEIMVPGNGQGFMGLATVYNGMPVIFYDSVWVQRLGGIGSPGFRFSRAHEYGHHRRNHALQQFNSPPAMLPYLSYQEELDADCYAVALLRSMGDMQAVQAGFAIYQQYVPPQDSQGRPGAINRLANMSHC